MKHNIVTKQQFRQLFLKKTSFLDVRAEEEYAKGSIPHSANFPILNNNERRQVGICYKQHGQQAAIKLGYRLVSGEKKTNRIQNWCEFIISRPDVRLYCWRGGMRSRIAQQWLSETGIDIPVIEGGYKALRHSLIEVIDHVADSVLMIRIGGKTGVAKTQLVNRIHGSIDLEQYANHRGSSFGGLASHQPTQINFEHAIAVNLLRILNSDDFRQQIFVEDESRNIGAVYIPLKLFHVMTRSPLVLVDMPLAFRIQLILQEYVINTLAGFEADCPEKGFDRFSFFLTDCLRRIQKRLGLERYRTVAKLMNSALDAHLRFGDVQRHEAWISFLLTEYYDPMYEYQIEKKKELVVFRGDYAAVLDWALQSHGEAMCNLWANR